MVIRLNEITFSYRQNSKNIKNGDAGVISAAFFKHLLFHFNLLNRQRD